MLICDAIPVEAGVSHPLFNAPESRLDSSAAGGEPALSASGEQSWKIGPQ